MFRPKTTSGASSVPLPGSDKPSNNPDDDISMKSQQSSTVEQIPDLETFQADFRDLVRSISQEIVEAHVANSIGKHLNEYRTELKLLKKELPTSTDITQAFATANNIQRTSDDETRQQIGRTKEVLQNQVITSAERTDKNQTRMFEAHAQVIEQRTNQATARLIQIIDEARKTQTSFIDDELRHLKRTQKYFFGVLMSIELLIGVLLLMWFLSGRG